MKVSSHVVGCGLLALVVGSSAVAEEASPAPLDWKEAARSSGLSAADIERLERSKVLVTNEAFKQVFTPYLGSRPNVALFITPDSLLNAFHVLYEESVLRLEKANTRKLPEVLSFMWDRMQACAVPEEARESPLAEGKRRAQVLVGTALELLGKRPTDLAPDMSQLIRDEAQRVTHAKGVLKPAWLGPPDPGFAALDYSRYRPRGFYRHTEELQQYFRAVSWLQSVPLRVSKDAELVTAMLLGAAIASEEASAPSVSEGTARAFSRQFRTFVGAGDDWDILTASDIAGTAPLRTPGLADPRVVREKREAALARIGELGLPQVNDTVRLPPSGDGGRAEANFRVLSAARIPESVVFTRTTNPVTRGFPNGLEVCVALGSDFARSELAREENGGEPLLQTIRDARRFFEGDSVYQEYLQCLLLLLDEPEPNAPRFMGSRAWRSKCCQSALAGWAQLRHTWSLQAKQSVTYTAEMYRDPMPDVVEPDPEFFSAFARLAKRTAQLLDDAGALDLDPADIAAELRQLAAWLQANDFVKKGWIGWQSYDASHESRVEWFYRIAHASGFSSDGPEDRKAAIEKIRTLARDAEGGRLAGDPKAREAVLAGTFDVLPLWEKLVEISRSLEAIARKELRREPLGEKDQDVIRSYGADLARVMLYAGNSYLQPRDDAPRIVDVHYNPNLPERPYLEVGIARPRALYVLYPGTAGEYLCRGAVLPYYEFKSPERLTDAEWKARLDGESRPTVPGWIAPILSETGLRAPKKLSTD